METLYQTVDRTGISIPLEIIQAYGLPEGTRIAISLQSDGIHVAPVEITQQEIENRSLRYLLRHVGDAMRIGVPQRLASGNWLVPVLAATGESAGELCFTAAGLLIQEQSTPVHRLLEGSDAS